MAESYVPMPFASGWVLERYLGWSVIRQEPQLKVLRRDRGPLRQFLALSRDGSDPAQLAEILAAGGFAPWRSSLVWNDFSDASTDTTRTLAGCRLQRALGPRWFGVGTFVVELSGEESQLLGNMESRERHACKRAQALGAVQEWLPRPSSEQLAEFLHLYQPVAETRGLELPPLALLERMSAAGDLYAARVRGAEGRTWVVNLIYRHGPNAWFLYGTRDPKAPGWAGPSAQWATIKALKQDGAAFYDLGLVASRDADDGIYRFKSGLGGRFISHGSEYGHVSSLVRFASAVRRRLTRSPA